MSIHLFSVVISNRTRFDAIRFLLNGFQSNYVEGQTELIYSSTCIFFSENAPNFMNEFKPIEKPMERKENKFSCADERMWRAAALWIWKFEWNSLDIAQKLHENLNENLANCFDCPNFRGNFFFFFLIKGIFGEAIDHLKQFSTKK